MIGLSYRQSIFKDDPGPSQVMLAEEFYATDVDGVPGSCRCRHVP
ncbi:unnamed protein product [Ascophyllum nodosum]